MGALSYKMNLWSRACFNVSVALQSSPPTWLITHTISHMAFKKMTLTVAKSCCWRRLRPVGYDVLQPTDHPCWQIQWKAFRAKPLGFLLSHSILISTRHSVFSPVLFFFCQLLLYISFESRGTRRADVLTPPKPPLSQLTTAIDLLHCADGSWWALGWCWSCASLPDRTGLATWCICYNVGNFLSFPCEETSKIRQ